MRSSNFFTPSQLTVRMEVGGVLGPSCPALRAFSEPREMEGLSWEQGKSRAGTGAWVWSLGLSSLASHGSPGAEDSGGALLCSRLMPLVKETFTILERR